MATIADALAQALDHHTAGRLGEAEDLYTRILTLDPDNPDALHLLGVLVAQVGRGDLALDLIGRAIGKRPDAATFHASRADVLHGLERFGEAVRACEAALVLDPALGEAWALLGLCLRTLRCPDAAITALARGVALRPGFTALAAKLAGLLGERARLRLESGRHRNALPDLVRAVALVPDDPDLAYLLGFALDANGCPEEAVGAYRRALALSPDFVGALHNLGLTLGQTGLLASAALILERAVRIDPDHAELRSGFDAVLRLMGMAGPDGEPPERL